MSLIDREKFETTDSEPEVSESTGVFVKEAATSPAVARKTLSGIGAQASRVDWGCLEIPPENRASERPARRRSSAGVSHQGAASQTGSTAPPRYPRIVRMTSDGDVLSSTRTDGAVLAREARSTQWLATMLGQSLGLPLYRSVHIHSRRSARVLYRSKQEHLILIDDASHQLSDSIRITYQV